MDEEEEKEDTRTRRTASLRQRISAGAQQLCGGSAPLAAPLARVQLVQAATELHNFSNGPVVCPPLPPHSSV